MVILYLAHINKNGEGQSIEQHLSNVEELCRQWAVEPIKDLAAVAGKLHDIGKYSDEFQKRINGNNHIQVEHAICGAKEVKKIFGMSPCVPLLEYVIAGHHTGLPDGGSRTDTPDKTTLQGRMKRPVADYSAYKKEITVPSLDNTAAFDYVFKGSKDNDDITERFSFLVKYVFSCLCDADYIDTERFCNPEIKRGMNGDFKKALEKLNEHLKKFISDTPVKKARCSLQNQAIKNFDDNADISILQMPTGSGKTLCSLKLALEYAIRTGKERIIYIIPYTSIIEQTADTFSKIFGDTVEILQHHSNFDFNNKSSLSTTTAEKLKKSCENWDSKFIVTTNAQFFQSMYHYKGSRLRKLHNLSNAVLVFDEIHMLPINHLQPCLRGIGYITKYLNSHAIFLSATMPDFMPLLKKYAPTAKIHELITDKSDFSSFKNCRYTFLGKQDNEQIAMLTSQQKNSLCVVNSRKSARDLYSLVTGKKFHLSTFMTPVHRSEILKKIKECLSRNEHITVVSTSLIEAGVDLDFDTVFRQLAGLDNILQSGGRCNREGQNTNSEVFVFENDERMENDLGVRSEVARSLLKEYEDINTSVCIKDYYGRIFKFRQDVIEQNSIARYNDCHFDAKHTINDIPFRSYAEYFEYINSESIAVVIPHTPEAEDYIKKAEFDSSVKRNLQRYSVPVYPHMLTDLIERGIVAEQSGMFVLQAMNYYNEDTGLSDTINDTELII